MKAVISREVGGPEALRLEDLPDPEARPGHVVVDVKACGVNYPDALIIRDLYQFKPGRPFSRTELCERVWQRDHEYDTRTVEIFITRLRKKIDSGFGTPLIQTLRGVGYTLKSPA